jgi:hypothetical protein
MKSNYLEFLPQYHFDRDDFCECFRSIFSDDKLCDLEEDCQAHRTLSEFILYYDEDEFYIIHLPSGTMINWYKHLGRTNTCNKEGFTLDDLREFLQLLKDDLSE